MAKKEHIHKCAECLNAELHQWGNDPVIAKCQVIPNAPRQVANSLIKCSTFAPRSRLSRAPAIIKHNE